METAAQAMMPFACHLGHPRKLRSTASARYTAKKDINCEWLDGMPWPTPLPGERIRVTGTSLGRRWVRWRRDRMRSRMEAYRAAAAAG